MKLLTTLRPLVARVMAERALGATIAPLLPSVVTTLHGRRRVRFIADPKDKDIHKDERMELTCDWQ